MHIVNHGDTYKTSDDPGSSNDDNEDGYDEMSKIRLSQIVFCLWCLTACFP